ncbi:MAG TPA: glycosyltransferase family 1 protein [Bacteroidales bacterium]|nr:glycosyltransferase family 1 protein [Bacteroidales bacterium]
MKKEKLRIAVNTRLLLRGKLEGIGWFTFEAFSRIAAQHPEVEFYFLFDRPYSQEFVFAPNITPVVLFPQARHPILYLLYFEIAITRWLARMSPDLFVSPDGFLSLSWAGKQLSIIHDLNFMHHPDFLPWAERIYCRSMFPLFARKAERVATVSEYSKVDLEKTFKLPGGKIDVVYNGINPIFVPLAEEDAMECRAETTGGVPYFVFVGSLHKRKNIENMLLAFDHFKSSYAMPFKLIIVGEHMFGKSYLNATLEGMRFSSDVVFLGRLYKENLHRVVASAHALLLVSHFEGFGVPIVEAMRCGVPVVTSNVSSMPEIAGDAALLVCPKDVSQISDAMLSLATNTELCNDLINKGFSVSAKFTWDKTAKRLWDSIMKCIE